MKEITQIENYAVEIWRRPYQRSMNLTMRPDGRLRVTCGRRISLGEITRFVGESRAFIMKRALEFESLRARFPEKEYVSGEKFLFFGEERPLEIIWTWAARIRVEAQENSLEMLAPLESTRDERRKAMHKFYSKQARLHLEERVAEYARRMDLHPRSVSIRGQRTRWGSCSSRAEINLNWKLLAAPLDVIDYVVVHELAHIQHMDHSPKFWSLVEAYCPGSREMRRWLKAHEYEIDVQFRK